MASLDLSGLFYYLPNTNQSGAATFVPVPLIRVNIRARVVNFISEVEVTQEYQNKEKEKS